jgi:competence CoiA-like predicted nuclease
MNQRDLMIKKKQSLSFLKFQDRMFRNCIRYSSNRSESDKHFIAKCVICRELTNNGFEFVTEARFEQGGRCDVLVLDKGLAIEILCSEKESNVVNKVVKYPVCVEFLKLKDSMNVQSIVDWLVDVLN